LLAGALGGFIPLFQKISTSETGRRSSLINIAGGPLAHDQDAGGGLLREAGEIFANPYTIVWVALSVLSMIVLQFAFKKEKAIRVIPAYTSSLILLPVIGGIIFFGERLTAVQVAGVVVTLCGVVVITMRRDGRLKSQGRACT
jgi:multidrug transporter EmrE-like cation transporter